MHPLTDQLPDHMDALALRQACGEIEAQLRAEVERLREALLDVARRAEALKQPVHMDNPESPQAARNMKYMAISYAARAALEATK